MAASIIGIVAAFLPWASITILGLTVTVSGIEGDGFITLVLFAVSLALCFIGTRSEPLGKIKFICAVIGIACAAIALFSPIEIGGILTLLAGISVCIFSFIRFTPKVMGGNENG
jgi:hypothetical protein